MGRDNVLMKSYDQHAKKVGKRVNMANIFAKKSEEKA